MRDKPEEAVQASEDGAQRDRSDASAVAPEGQAEGRPSGGRSIRNLGTIHSLRNPVFRLYFASVLGQMSAQNMQMMTRSLLTFRISDSAAVIGLMALATAVPLMFFSLFGGVGADRLPKKYVLLVGHSMSAIVAVIVALSLSFGYLSEDKPNSWWILIVTSLAQGTIMGLMMPSRQSMIADIVGEEQLMNAVSLNTFGMNTLRLVAPASAGFLIAAFGFQAIYFSMTGMYAMAALFLLPMPLTRGTSRQRPSAPLTDLKAGLRYVWHETTILLILVITLFITLLSMPYQFMMPVFTEDILEVGASSLGLLISISGLGAMAGSLILASLPNKKRGAMLVLGGGVLMSIPLMAFAFSEWFYISLGIIFFVGVGQSMRMTLGNTLIMYYVDPDYRGRVMSLVMTEVGLTQLGVFVAGVLADSIGIQVTVGGLALMLLIASILTFIFVPRIRKLD